jgi:hypothetical protein
MQFSETTHVLLLVLFELLASSEMALLTNFAANFACENLA